MPLQDLINLLKVLFNTVPQGDDLEPLLAAAAYFYCASQGDGHPQFEDLQQACFKLLAGAASMRGIQDPEGLQAWVVQEQLNDPQVFLPRLMERLEALVGDDWLFDRAQV